jgi:hypothetical protein
VAALLLNLKDLDKIWHPANFLDGSRWIDSNRDCGICLHSAKIKQILTILNVSGQQFEDTDWHYCGYWVDPENAIDRKKPFMTCRQAALKLRSLADSAMIAAENPHPASTPGVEHDFTYLESYQKSTEDLAQLLEGMKRAKRVLPEYAPLQVVLDAKSLCDQLCLAAFGTVDPITIISLTKEVKQGCPQRP